MATATTLPKQAKKWNVQEVADYLGVSVKTVRRWDEQGIIPSGRRLGGDRVIRWDSAAIERWFQTQPAANK